MSQPEQWKVDSLREIAYQPYFWPLEDAVKAGEPTWVTNFLSRELGTFSGYFQEGELIGLIREQKNRNYLIYDMQEGQPVPIATRSTIEAAKAVLDQQTKRD